MAQPRDYTRQYNFDDYQTTAPNDPLPGSQVDAELNAVKLTLDDLNENIGLIQRDDGLLRNQAVHKDAFDAGALALINADSFNPRGDWATSTVYAVNDLVDFNGATYLATVAHTASSAFTTDLAADKWILLANAAIATTAAAVDKYEGDGNTTAFTLQYQYAADTSALVFVNGALRNPGDDYTISGNQITFVTAPSSPAVQGNENVIVWGASVVAQAAKEAAEAAEANASGFADEAEDWANLTTGDVDNSGEYSSKAYAVGGTGVDAGAGSSKDWATKTTGTVGNSGDYSAKHWATTGTVATVSSNIADVNTVAGQISPTNNVGTVAGIAADVTAVAADATDIGVVSSNIADVNGLAAISADVTSLNSIKTDVTTVAGIQANVTTTAGISTQIQNVSGISADVTGVNAISSAVTTVSGISTDVSAVAADATDIGVVSADISGSNTIGTVAASISSVNTTATNIANVNLTGANIADVNTVAAEITNNNLQTVAADIQAVVDVANDLNEATSEIDVVANNIANVNAVGTDIANVNSVAANIADVNNFADTYFVGTTAPASPTTGDLWFDSNVGVETMKVYGSSGWQNAGSSVNGTSSRNTYTATGGQTSFAATYDAGFVDVYRNGVKLVDGSDFTATNGTSIVLSSGATVGDIIDIVAYGTFNLNATALDDLSDVSSATATSGQFLKYNGTNWVPDTVSTDLVADTTPQLGGNLDLNSSSITGTGNINITGSVTSDDLTVEGTDGIIGRFKTTSGANNTVINVTSSDAAGTAGFSVGGNASFPAMTFENGGSERMRITSGGSLAINTQTSPIEKVNLHDGNIRLSGTDDARIQFLNSPTASYNVGTSGGAAIRFHRPTSGHEAIAFETHDTGVSHAERMRIHPEGYVTMPYTPIVAMQDIGTSNSATTIMSGWNVSRNNGNHFNNSNGLFTCPITGYYEISMCAQSTYATGYNWIAIFHNGGVRDNIHWNPDNNQGHYNLSITHVIYAAANDTLGVGQHNANGVANGYLSDACATIKLIG